MDDLLQHGIDAFKAGDREKAREIFRGVTERTPDDERAWGWMYNVCETNTERIECLEQIVRVNPANDKALNLLRELNAQDFPLERPEPAAQAAVPPPPAPRPAISLPSAPVNKVGGYVSSVLLPQERVLAVARIHWSVVLPSVILGLVSLIIALLVFAGGSPKPKQGNETILLLYVGCCFPLFLITTASFIQALVKIATTEFALTDQRVIAKVGFIRRSTLELVLGKVESLGIHQTIGGRILNFGTLLVVGSGGTHQAIGPLAEPMKLKGAIDAVLGQVRVR